MRAICLTPYIPSEVLSCKLNCLILPWMIALCRGFWKQVTEKFFFSIIVAEYSYGLLAGSIFYAMLKETHM